MESISFSWTDYTLFTIIISISCFIGLYFGLYSKQKSTNDYLFGGKNMKWLPVSVSLAASALSGQSILGLATEVYLHGSQVFLMCVSNILASLVNYYFFLPVFCNLQLVNIFEYLELRFNNYIKHLAVIIILLTAIIVLPLFMYSPSLTFTQVTGIDVHIILPIMTLVCVFYTSLGGVKAVIWADGLQLIVTVVTLITVLVLGIISAGGFSVVIQRGNEGGRLSIFDFNPDPTVRISFWSILLGYTLSRSTLLCAGPHEVQRCLSISKNLIKRLTITYTGIFCVVKVMCMFMGLVIYAKYFRCDPKMNGNIKKADQILPYFISDIAAHIPGLNGIFVAALFGSALSSCSTTLNTMAGVIHNDIAPWFISKKILMAYPSTCMKIIVVILGVLSVGFMYVMEKVGTIFEIYYYLKGITGGSFFGIFILGLFIPFSNTKGAFTGGVASLLLMSIIVINNQIYVWNGSIRPTTKPLHTYGCTTNFTITNSLNTTSVTDQIHKEPFWLFRISFQYYDLIGTLITILVGIPVSWFTKTKDDLPVNFSYICPALRRFCYKPNVIKDIDETKALTALHRKADTNYNMPE